MAAKPPVEVVHLFAEERSALLRLLAALASELWTADTACPGWSVKDIAAHILGDDFNLLSGSRDGYRANGFAGGSWTDLVAYLNAKNQAWVEAARRLSPALLTELLSDAGRRTQAFYEQVDLMIEGPNVAWAGPGQHAMWLHVAREYTERWQHQMQIREAIGAPALYEPRLFRPVLATFAYALPVAYRDVAATDGTSIQVRVEGGAGVVWTLRRSGDGWSLAEGSAPIASAIVTLDQVTAWKLWTRGIGPEEARMQVRVEGDQRLGEPVLRAVAIIA